MKYSASTGGFYLPEIHGLNIPADAVDITDLEHEGLMQAQAAGMDITADSEGRPIATPRPGLSENDLIASQIAELEATITPRRMREAAIGTDGGWLKEVDEQIATLRKTLK